MTLGTVEKFDGTIIEPAAGDGAISKVLQAHGYDVTSRDLIDRGFCVGGHDYLQSTDVFDNVITNPPFTLAEEFVRHALAHSRKKVVILGKLQFLEGVKRKILFESSPLRSVYVFSKRLTMTRNGEKSKSSGMICFAWYVFEHGYIGKPKLGWL